MGIMRKSQLNKAKQDRLIEHFVAGATARCAVDLVRVNLKKANIFVINYRKSLLIILSKRLTLFLAERLKLMKAILAASVRANVVEVRQGKSQCLAF